MLHLHIFSWVIGIILFIVSYLSFTQSGAPKKAYKTIAYDFKIILSINLVQRCLASGRRICYRNRKHAHVINFKMVCGVGVVALMEVTLVRKQRGVSHKGLFWGLSL